MSDKFQNKYRIQSVRLQNWDYHWSAAYFITICTRNRECFFGKVVQIKGDTSHIVQLSEIGRIVESEWIKTFEIRPDMKLEMGEYVIMPNHFHAIIVIGENIYNQFGDRDDKRRDAMHCVSTFPPPIPQPFPPPIPQPFPQPIPPSFPPPIQDISTHGAIIRKNQFGPQYRNLASVIRGFKIGVTINARKIDKHFAWQSRYHDHIIHDGASFQRIKNYIIGNPEKWANDKYFFRY